MNEVYGMSFSKNSIYACVIRKGAIKNSTLSIQQIAEISRFSSTQIFCKTFNKYTGAAPSECKKSCSD